MTIRWNRRESKEDHRVFETMREAMEWADSIASEFYGNVVDGYRTEDVKVAAALTFLLCSSFKLHVKQDSTTAPYTYIVWVERDPCDVNADIMVYHPFSQQIGLVRALLKDTMSGFQELTLVLRNDADVQQQSRNFDYRVLKKHFKSNLEKIIEQIDSLPDRLEE